MYYLSHNALKPTERAFASTTQTIAVTVSAKKPSTFNDIHSAPLPKPQLALPGVSSATIPAHIVVNDSPFTAWPATPSHTVEELSRTAAPDALGLSYPTSEGLLTPALYPSLPVSAPPPPPPPAHDIVLYRHTTSFEKARPYSRRGARTRPSSVIQYVRSSRYSSYG